MDLFAVGIPDEIIYRVLEHCNKYPENIYLFQSKNTKRLIDFYWNFKLPHNSIIGTTIETNRGIAKYSKAPKIFDRYYHLSMMRNVNSVKKMISIEPIMDFDVGVMVYYIKSIQPDFVSIGADSKGNNLSEPPSWKVKKLIEELEKFTEVRIKKNLNRLLEEVKK